ncbi:uncharacterized protein LOC112571616 isoform X1 [Pomacea canaliculata]|uniref:uncharacterized protein LOC112571616 isoform X1 n=1 Tax=Pomacea canaliculata TaxID=400727 RepID=UPI000D73D895|nr:uncharacterized protein LOC112571616 isoform X1 [Pomacea canaliculata]
MAYSSGTKKTTSTYSGCGDDTAECRPAVAVQVACMQQTVTPVSHLCLPVSTCVYLPTSGERQAACAACDKDWHCVDGAGVALKEDVSSVTPQGSCADTGGGACYNSLTMDALMAACLLMASAVPVPVSGSTLCVFKVSLQDPPGNLSYTEKRWCQYGCCHDDCCLYSVALVLWSLVGVVLGVVLTVSVISSAVVYCYRRHRQQMALTQYGRCVESE